MLGLKFHQHITDTPFLARVLGVDGKALRERWWTRHLIEGLLGTEQGGKGLTQDVHGSLDSCART